MNGTHSTLDALKELMSAPALSVPRPVTSNARWPISLAAGATSPAVPGPKTMRAAVANSKRISYQPSSPGKTLEYFTLVRGSAIISATRSRQAA
jgi:hypothetical protein